jgi:hypothetical protein
MFSDKSEKVRDLFRGRTLMIASMHRKEKAIIPVLKKVLGIIPFVPSDLDTDAFGTFSGEIPRNLDPVQTLKAKCQAALALHPHDLVIASEGSFGPHPDFPFIPVGEEWLLFLDQKLGLELLVGERTMETNFSSKRVSSEIELMEFARSVSFPSHGLILKSGNFICKGIRIEDELKWHFHSMKEASLEVEVQTDMRAMHNPTRMKSIRRLSEKLMKKLLKACPRCHYPGLDLLAANPGLPCAACGIPGKLIASFDYCCKNCGLSLNERNQELEGRADPQFCDYCNP